MGQKMKLAFDFWGFAAARVDKYFGKEINFYY